MQIRTIILSFIVLSSAEIFSAESSEDISSTEISSELSLTETPSHEHAGTISIAERYLTRIDCQAEGKGIIELNPIIKYRNAGSYDYPKVYLNHYNFDKYEISDWIMNANKESGCLEYPYKIMPEFITNIYRKSKIFILVHIKLENGNHLLSNSTFCYLPLITFKNEDNSFKNSQDIIKLIMHFTDYKNEMHDFVFNLTLDDTFNNIETYYDEFIEDDGKSCPAKTVNCLSRAIKKLGNYINRVQGIDEEWEYID